MEGAAPGVLLVPGVVAVPAPLSVPLVPPVVPPLVPGAVLEPGVLGVALELGVEPEVSGAVEPLVPVPPPGVELVVPLGAVVVPPVVPPALPVAPDVLEGVLLVSPVVPLSFFPHAPKARVATSAASNTECFTLVPLKKYSCKLSTRLI